jgi:hypothetical protein
MHRQAEMALLDNRGIVDLNLIGLRPRRHAAYERKPKDQNRQPEHGSPHTETICAPSARHPQA